MDQPPCQIPCIFWQWMFMIPTAVTCGFSPALARGGAGDVSTFTLQVARNSCWLNPYMYQERDVVERLKGSAALFLLSWGERHSYVYICASWWYFRRAGHMSTNTIVQIAENWEERKGVGNNGNSAIMWTCVTMTVSLWCVPFSLYSFHWRILW